MVIVEKVKKDFILLERNKEDIIILEMTQLISICTSFGTVFNPNLYIQGTGKLFH